MFVECSVIIWSASESKQIDPDENAMNNFTDCL